MGAAAIGALATIAVAVLQDDDPPKPPKPPETVVVSVDGFTVDLDTSQVSAFGRVTGDTAVLVTLGPELLGDSWASRATVDDNGQWTATLTAVPPPVPMPATVQAFAVPGTCAAGASCANDANVRVGEFVECIESAGNLAACVDDEDFADSASKTQ